LLQREVDPQYRKMAGSLRGVYHGRVLTGMKKAEAAIGSADCPGTKLLKRADELVDR
jgi:hypothetical protein